MSVSLLRGRTVRRALGVLVVAGLLGAGATGCSNDAGAKTENTVDASPTPTNTPTDGDGDSAEEPAQDTPAEPEQRPVPEEPEAMKTGDKAGAIAAAKFFVEVIEYSMHTSTTDLLEKYSYEKCGRCNHLIDVINNRIHEDATPISSSYTIKNLESAIFAGEGDVVWKLPVLLEIEEKYLEEPYKVEDSAEIIIIIAYENTGWVLIEIEGA